MVALVRCQYVSIDASLGATIVNSVSVYSLPVIDETTFLGKSAREGACYLASFTIRTAGVLRCVLLLRATTAAVYSYCLYSHTSKIVTP